MFTLTIDTGNAAFHDDTDVEGDDTGAAAIECARILRAVATALLNYTTDGRCIDSNGNRAGSWELSYDRRGV